jgi:hypothetical protein
LLCSRNFHLLWQSHTRRGVLEIEHAPRPGPVGLHLNHEERSHTEGAEDIAIPADYRQKWEPGSVMKRSQLEDNTVVELLDRVLDNGIVVDPSARVYLIGHDLSTSKRRVVVEWIQTHV